MPKELQKSGLSSNNQLNKVMLQNQVETGKLFSISMGSWRGKNNNTSVSYKQIQLLRHCFTKGSRWTPVTCKARELLQIIIFDNKLDSDNSFYYDISKPFSDVFYLFTFLCSWKAFRSTYYLNFIKNCKENEQTGSQKAPWKGREELGAQGRTTLRLTEWNHVETSAQNIVILSY